MSPPPQRSSADLAHEREILEEMLLSEGWTVFCRKVYQEWKGDGYSLRIDTALAKPDPMLEVKVLQGISKEIERMFKWPVDRVNHLKGHVE